jgi:biopolymer transport protein TolQ
MFGGYTMAAPILAIVNPVTIFTNCDAFGQSIVGILCVASITAWAIMLGKRRDLQGLSQLNRAFDRRLREERRVLDLPESLRTQRSIPYADLVAEATDAYWRAAKIGQERGTDTHRFRLEHAENALQRALARQTLHYESNMVFLASVASGAPFLGLLGTVWGVMTAFSEVGLQQTASIQTLAPGVSEALLTTICGLLVAIPSLFGYNWLLSRTRIMITELENFASAFADRIELESE